MYPKHTFHTESEPGLGQYLGEIERIAPLSDQEIEKLLARLPERTARDRLIEGHLPLVVQIARAYQHNGILLSDLIQIGSLCLIEEIATWTPDASPSLPQKTLLAILHQAMEQAITAEVRQYGNAEPCASRSPGGHPVSCSRARKRGFRHRRGRNARRRRQAYQRAAGMHLPVKERFIHEACAGCIAPLLRLSRRQREILSARISPADLSYRLIAEHLEMNSRTARRHAARGLRKLRRARAFLCLLRRLQRP